MNIQVKQITSTSDLVSVYKLRKQVFVDEEKRFEFSLDHIIDQFDSLKETVNFAAMLNGEIIAAARVTMDSKAGLPVDLYPDIFEFKKKLTGRCMNIGWLCCTKPHRHKTGLIKALIRQAAYEAKKQGCSHMISVIHPPTFDLLHHSFNVQKIGPEFYEKILNVQMVPIHATVNDIIGHIAEPLLKDDPGHHIKELGFSSRYHYLEEALSRNIGIFSLSEQDRIMESRIAIPGLGGVGGQHLVTLARAGVGKFNIADFDQFEPVNFNRQYGARASQFGQPKINVMHKETMDINPFLDIKLFPDGISEQNIDEFLDNVDLVADGMDFFNFDIRRLIFNKAREKRIPVVTAGPLGFSTAMLVFMPDKGMSFDEYFDITGRLTLEEKLIKFFIGLAPKATQASYIDPDSISMRDKKGPSMGAGCQICSGVVTAEAIRILLNKKGIKPAPHYFQYDPFTRKFHQGYLSKGNRHFLQKIKYMMVKKKMGKKKPLIIPVEPPKVLPSNESNGNTPDDIIKYIVTAGCQAPSGDNCQPWRFDYSDNVLKILLDPLADDSFFNVNQTASYIACGAAAENISIAASRYGIKCSVNYIPDNAQPDLVVKISFSQTGNKEDPLQRFIWERHTNRTKFNKKPINKSDLTQISGSISSFHDSSLTLITDRIQIDKIAQLVYEADKIRAERKDLHKHLMAMIRFTEKDAMEKKDGFPIKNLEAGIGGEVFLKFSRPWAIMDILNKTGMGKMIPYMASQGIKQASAVGMLKMHGNSVQDFIIGGQALERVWLTCTRLGISFQPMTAVTLFRQRWELGQKNDFSLRHQQLLGKIWPLYEYLFKTKPNESHIMLFRLGYSGKPSCKTLRKEPVI
jgi:molybdopterin/thiamine biosynthesis adenylyltransferase/predicted GNAT family N-acyltransferase